MANKCHLRYNHDLLTAAITADGLRPAQRSSFGVGVGGAAPDKAAPALDAAAALAARCWSNDPGSRPRLPEILSSLDVALSVALGLWGTASRADLPFLVPVAHEGLHAAAKAAGDPTSADGDPISADGDPISADGDPTSAPPVTAPVSAPITAPAMAPATAPALSDLLGFVDGLSSLLGLSGAPNKEGAPMMRVGWEASAGRRGADRMEDRHVLCSRPGVALAAVFDGCADCV
jgi:hypothetical protein